jgi:tricarboxylate carrier
LFWVELIHLEIVRDAIIHADTGEEIFLPFRLSAFAPMNIAICAGLLIPNPSLATAIFWQWFNQSYNVGVNHANRNASNQMSNRQIMEAYGGAVVVSCSLAGGLGELVKRATALTPAVKTALQRLVPFTAVAAAGVVNVFLMRRNEMTEGIVVKDKDGNPLPGRSKKAGLLALTQTAISRCVTSFIVLTVPPVLLACVEKTAFVKRRPKLVTPLNLFFITGMLFAALPVAIAVFPQNAAISAHKLEPHYHNLKDREGRPITTVYYNKGL